METIVVTLDDIKRLVNALPPEEKEQLLIEELAELSEEVRTRILNRYAPPMIVNYGQGSTINSNSFQINAPDAATAMELVAKLKQSNY